MNKFCDLWIYGAWCWFIFKISCVPVLPKVPFHEMMAGKSSTAALFQSLPKSSSPVSHAFSCPTKVCLFCLNPADYTPVKDGATDWNLKNYFSQFLWKYLIGDDAVKINEFTGKHLRNNVPPLCLSCHERCVQLATYHLEFEKIQDAIMDVAQDLLEGWKMRDTLLSKKEYEGVVQSASRANHRPRVPFNRFIKSSPTSSSGTHTAFPTYETVQMYQILRSKLLILLNILLMTPDHQLQNSHWRIVLKYFSIQFVT